MVGALMSLLGASTLPNLRANDPSAFVLENVGTPFQEQYAKNIFLELRSIHLATENVCGGKEVTFQFLQRELGHLFTIFCATQFRLACRRRHCAIRRTRSRWMFTRYHSGALQGSTISTPHPSKSGTLRVARAAPRDRAIAAI